MSRPKSGHKPEANEGVVTEIPASSGENVLPPLEEQISRRAYELYEQRGEEDGHAEEDWLRAEREILEAAFPPEKA